MSRTALTVAALLTLCVTAHAHTPFESSAIVRVHRGWLELAVRMSPVSAQTLLGHPDEQAVSAQDSLAAYRSELEQLGPRLYSISAGTETRLSIQRTEVQATDTGDLLFRLAAMPYASGSLRFHADYLDELIKGHTATLLVQDEQGRALLWGRLSQDRPALSLDISSALARRPQPVMPGFGSFFALGVEHILTGYDHLLFLAGLLAVCRRLASMLAIVTSFTLAHSLTLALAALEIAVVPGSLVEALIAASIVFVGVENLMRRDQPRARWALALVFGLVHGLGFAGALRETGLGADGAPMILPLLGFNLGVETGQLAVVIILLPALLYLWRRPAIARPATAAISVVVVALGAYWLVGHLASSG